MSKAIAGDARAGKDVLDRLWKLELERSAAPGHAAPFTEADREVIAEIHRRLGAEPGGDAPESARPAEASP